jgi:divalent metal cation (Fe/Co/Zn/Cd) transporter
MGRKPNDTILSEIISVAKSTKGVRGTNDIFAHYIGTSIYVEIHIEVDKKMSLERAHKIGNEVKVKIQSIADIDRSICEYRS